LARCHLAVLASLFDLPSAGGPIPHLASPGKNGGVGLELLFLLSLGASGQQHKWHEREHNGTTQLHIRPVTKNPAK